MAAELNGEQATLLLVEDDPGTRLSLEEGLRRAGWSVVAVASGREAIELVQRRRFAVVLTDLRLPGGDGVAVMEAARERWPETQVILLTAHGSLQSAVRAVREGAFDYILKPASLETIRERVREALARYARDARLRRALELLREEPEAASGPRASGTPIEAGPISLNLETRQAWYGGRELDLTPTEFELLRALAREPRVVLSQQELVRFSHGLDLHEQDARHLLKPHLSRLRAKLARASGGADPLVNVRGQGYRLEA